MSQDNKEVETEETTSQPASTETNESGVETPEQTKTAKPVAPKAETNEIDYKAELAEREEQLRQAEHVIVDTKRKNKELERTAASTSNPDTDLGYKPEDTVADIEARIEQRVEERLSKVTADLTADIFEEELAAASSNPDEAKLIQFHYQNTLKQSGASRKAIRADLQAAKALANQKRVLTENSELKQALKAKHTAGRQSIGSNQDPLTPDDSEEPTFSEADRQVIEHRAQAEGLTFKEYVRRNRTKLTNP